MLPFNFVLTILIFSFSASSVKCSKEEKITDETSMETKPKYDIVFGQETLNNLISYKIDLIDHKIDPGFYLEEIINAENIDLNEVSTEEFVELLLLTKKPITFAESEIKGGGLDWNSFELQILGDLSIVMNVEIYDNGVWNPHDTNFRIHNPPLNGQLMFTPGPLLRGSIRGGPPDLNEVVSGDDIDQDKYNQLIERRLMPLFYYANKDAKKTNQCALITIPGIGCGAFAGKFRGKMCGHLNQALQNILRKHAKSYDNIACIYFDPHRECTNETQQFEGVSYRVRPAVQNHDRSQLCNPNEYAEPGDDFSNCKLFKIVAWDHVSLFIVEQDPITCWSTQIQF